MVQLEVEEEVEYGGGTYEFAGDGNYVVNGCLREVSRTTGHRAAGRRGLTGDGRGLGPEAVLAMELFIGRVGAKCGLGPEQLSTGRR